MFEKKLWTEKYRPKDISEYVFVDERQKSQIMGWLQDDGRMPLLLYGSAGTGKSSLAKVLIHELNIHEYDILEINASRENSVDIVREKISGFMQTMPFGTSKVVFLDEFDFTSPAFQAALRSDMETYSGSVLFLLTGNFPHKIIPAIKSRCVEFSITKPDKIDFITRAATVLLAESIDFELETLESYVTASYPDLRKCLGLLQANSTSGTLISMPNVENSEDGVLLEAIGLLKSGKIFEARQQLLHYLAINPSRIEDLYKFMYDNLELWGNTQEEKDAAILIIRNGLANLSLVAIPEISLAATLCELEGIRS